MNFARAQKSYDEISEKNENKVFDSRANESKGRSPYDENAVVQQTMAKKLAGLIAAFSPLPPLPLKLLEIGCGTGFLTKHLFEMFEDTNCEIFLNDINENQTEFGLNYIRGDILKVNIPNKLDLIASNAVFQWIDNNSELFLKLNNSLNPGGILAFSTFGVQNYKQFNGKFDKNTKSALNYLELQELENKLIENSFEILHLEEEISTLYFNSPREVLTHIKTTGVSTFGDRENAGLWGKTALNDFEKQYFENNSDNNGVELTYHPIFCVAKK